MVRRSVQLRGKYPAFNRCAACRRWRCCWPQACRAATSRRRRLPRRRRRRSPWRSRSSAPSPTGTSSPAASRRSRKSRSAPASAASSTSIEFKDGDFVKPGDLLYVIDSRPFEAVAQQADGQLADARAKAELAKRELERALTLVTTSAVSESIVDQRRQTLQAAHAAEMQAEGALKAAKLNVEFTHVIAPITGRVSRHLVSVGNLVQGGDGGATLLTSIVSLDPIYIYFDMDEATYLKYNKLWFEGKRPSSRDTANPVQVTLAGETKPSHDGKMDFLDNRLDVSTGTLRSRAIVPNKDLSILPGQFGRVRLIGSAPYEALLLPDSGDRDRPVAQDRVRGQQREHGRGAAGDARAARRRPARHPRRPEGGGQGHRRRPPARPRRRQGGAASAQAEPAGKKS